MRPDNDRGRPGEKAAPWSNGDTTRVLPPGDTGTDAAPPTEPSAWLRGAVARRLRQVEAMRLDLAGCSTVIAPLGKPAAPGSDDDRTCDRCGHYTPVGGLFYCIASRPTAWLTLTGGLCAGCAELETP